MSSRMETFLFSSRYKCSTYAPSITLHGQAWTTTKLSIQNSNNIEIHVKTDAGYTLKDIKSNIWIQNTTKLKDVVETIAMPRWNYFGHMLKYGDKMWTSFLPHWRPTLERQPPMLDERFETKKLMARWRNAFDIETVSLCEYDLPKSTTCNSHICGWYNPLSIETTIGDATQSKPHNRWARKWKLKLNDIK